MKKIAQFILLSIAMLSFMSSCTDMDSDAQKAADLTCEMVKLIGDFSAENSLKIGKYQKQFEEYKIKIKKIQDKYAYSKYEFGLLYVKAFSDCK